MSILRGILGVAFILVLSYFISNNKKAITKRIRSIILMFVLQLVITFISLRTSIGITVLGAISDFFNWLMDQAISGVDFVFGGIVIEEGATVFFLHVLLPLIFFAVLIAILDYIKVLPFIMKWVGFIINKITGAGELEGEFSISATLLGQPAGYLTIAERIPKISSRRMFTLCLVATSTIGANMLGAYMQIIPGEYVVVAVFLNIFSAFIVSSLINPYENEEEGIQEEVIGQETDETDNTVQEKDGNIFSVISEAITNGFNLAIGVATSVIGFIALITFLNNSLDFFVGVTFTEVVGYIFSPIAYLIGIPIGDIIDAGGVMAIKLFTNELVGMGELADLVGTVTEKTYAMISVYLLSFANFGTLGIILGALKSIDKKQATNISRQSLKLLLGATISSLLTATVVGMFF